MGERVTSIGEPAAESGYKTQYFKNFRKSTDFICLFAKFFVILQR